MIFDELPRMVAADDPVPVGVLLASVLEEAERRAAAVTPVLFELEAVAS